MRYAKGPSEPELPPPDPAASEAEARVLAATVGEPHVLNDIIELSPYDPAWPSLFESLAQQICISLGEKVVQLEHVGSTSVPGLSAKPIIDVLLAVEDSSDEAAYVPPLEAAGFMLRIREPDWYQHRMLSPMEIRANVHVFSAGCPEVERMLRFRDRLRKHAGDRALYEETKRSLASQTWKYVQQYADAKSSVVEAILRRTGAG